MEAFFKPTSEISSQGALVLKLKIENEFKVKKGLMYLHLPSKVHLF